ncbi:MAG TPA: hypothetical protein ENH12_06285 [Proteobacteria bacterium]|nr:hypothetical protein [Pseudomonadota bacterium]
MKSIQLSLSLFGAVVLLTTGCAAIYQQDCRVYLLSEPSGAEIWKDEFYIGKTPYLLRYTATTIEDEQGYLRVPPLVIKKTGYKPQLLEMELDLEKGEEEGYYWEGTVVLEEIPGEETK